ncbi:PIG-L deacetylase family protein [Modestobacter marinus]|uniref:PIG-L deacetylase family protein n=1 Tax=Modestobacter marinus TaxID=477641 RepID=UPI001C94DAE1|nr:PIG-L deacetylase family protein [Modestobacter marinus]
MPRLQVVVAHPDDETFGCGSMLLHAAGAGAETAVVCATRGEEGGDVDGLGAVRERELREAAGLLRVSRVDLLDFADSGMSGEAPAGSLVSAPFEDVVAAVAGAVAAFRPDVLVTLDASDSHRDHVRIRDAALAAAETVGVPRVYLSCILRSLMRRWVDHVKVARPDMEHLNADVAGLGTPDEEITTVIDVAAHLPVREKAIALHASQTSPFEGLPEELRRAFLATDHLRRVVPPWPGGAPETRLLD